eukprot:TRINITY_DN94572_c0_g1_i1.p1 TRINITY_DN94572_c0_g1~~TRINITY_DN94572_c0_g1_i1.p1  ORF type:complete len:347 (+),score=98.24 TRINITY_DN94572_c0_g1_i1:119-1159(+)
MPASMAADGSEAPTNPSQSSSSCSQSQPQVAMMALQRLAAIFDQLLLRNRATAIIVTVYVAIFLKLFWHQDAAQVNSFSDGGGSMLHSRGLVPMDASQGPQLKSAEDVEPLTRSSVLASNRAAGDSSNDVSAGQKKGRRSVVLRKNMPGEDEEKKAKAQEALADEEDAADLLQRLLNGFEESKKASPQFQGENLARAWHTLSNMLTVRNRLAEAKKARLTASDHWLRIGAEHFEEKKEDSAASAFEQAVVLERQLQEGGSPSGEMPRLAAALANLGAVQLRRAQQRPDDSEIWDVALKSLKEAYEAAAAAQLKPGDVRVDKMKASYLNAQKLQVQKQKGMHLSVEL